VARGRSRRGGGRIATALFLVGCLGVLGLTFSLGVVTGRSWPRSSTPITVVAKGVKEPSPPTESAPALTFYQELTAPLSSPPPPAKSRPPRVEPPRLETPRPDTLRADTPRAEAPRVEKSDRQEAAPKADAVAAATPAPPAAPAKPVPGQTTFTVQVAAYKAKEPADALRAKLTAAGYEAYVVQVDTPGSARYRVRVGSFAARESAQQVADRIVGERSLPAFVTSR
jgi:cell division septation protein DedD